MCLMNRRKNIMNFLIKVIITIIVIAIAIAVTPTGFGCVIAYPLAGLIAKGIWDEE